MSFATLADMSVRVPGGIPTADGPRAEAYLEEASELVEEEYGATVSDVPALFRRITLSAALRAWFNPGYLSSEQLGDFSTRYLTGGGVYLTDDEKAKIAKIKASSGLWVQPIGRNDPLVHVRDGFAYVQDQSGGVSFPFVPVADE